MPSLSMTTYRRIDHHDGAAFLTTATLGGATAHESDTGTIVLAPHVVGICRSDLREITGVRFGRRDFGHEIVATVVEAPPPLSVLRWRTVLFDPHPALAGKTSGFGEFVELNGEEPQLDAVLVPVPIEIPDHIAVFGEPLACAVHCVNRLHRVCMELGLQQRTPVAVLGAGMAGALISMVLVARGYRCVLLNHRRERIEFLRDRAVLPPPVLPPDIPDARFGCVILATAAATPAYLDICMNMLADDGVLMVFAGTQPGTHLHGLDVDRVRRHQLTQRIRQAGRPVSVAGTYGATRQDFTDALALLAHPAPADRWSPAACVQRLTTQTVGLDAAADYLTAHAVHGLFGKALVQIRPAIRQESR